MRNLGVISSTSAGCYHAPRSMGENSWPAAATFCIRRTPVNVIMIGSEYAGKTTLAVEISKWMIESMGLNMVVWHDHTASVDTDARSGTCG